MNGAELMAALETVEQDHELVLKKIAALKESVGFLLRPGEGDLRQVLHRLKEINDYLETNFTVHLLEEETTLFPLLAQLQPEGSALVDRLRQDHEEIRREQEEFASCLAVALELEDTLPKTVVRDLLIDSWELWDLLDKHAHVETQAVQQCFSHFLQDLGTGHAASGTAC